MSTQVLSRQTRATARDAWQPSLGEVFPQDLTREIPTLNIEYKMILLQEDIVLQLFNKLQEALDEISQLRKELSQRPLASAIAIYDLGNDQLQVKSPISVVLNETDEESLARWPETRAYGIGSTLAEAILKLKQNIADMFFDLKSRPQESLGEIARNTLRTLETHLQIVK